MVKILLIQLKDFKINMNIQQLTNEVNNLFFDNTSSYKTIVSIQKELLELIGAEIDIKNIDRKLIIKYFNILKQTGNKPATINNKMMYLSKNLNYAYENNLIKSKFKIPTIKNKNKKMKIINQSEYNQMISYALANNKKELYQVIVIGYNSGIRISNILALLPEDIDNNYIRIWRNKTNNPYSIPLNETLKELFKNFTGFILNYRQIQYQFEVMKKELNLDKRITIHTLRHTTCSKLIEENVALPVVQALMNHKNISTTMQYNHLKNKQLEEAVLML